jgi:TonB family protein
MCPFRKAFPFVVLLHLLLAVGIIAGYAEHKDSHVFTLTSAVGSGQAFSQGVVADDEEDARPQKDNDSNDSLDMMPPYDDEDDAAVDSPAAKIASFPTASHPPSAAGVAGTPLSALQMPGAAISVDQIGTRMTPPIALKRPRPHWSGVSHGQVTLAFTINKSGKVEGAEVESSASPEMSKAALSVLPKWHFTPAQENGRSIDLRVRQVVEF